MRMSPKTIAERNDELSVNEGICTNCGECCCPVVVDNSFDHAFGTHYVYDVGSPCCGEEVVDGGVKTIEQKTHVARKQHGRNISPGDTYSRELKFHWRENGAGWFTVNKKLLKKGSK